MSEPVLDIKGLRKSYGKVEAVRGVNLTIAPGEIVGLLGPNGAGKSTLFQIAAGLFAPDGGEVKLFDFGIVKAEGRVSKTDVGVVKGNVSFMSPEQARGLAVDARSDLFSLGLVLYFASQGAGKALGPVLGATVRLLVIAIGGTILGMGGAPVSALFALVASSMVAYGLATAAAVHVTPWHAARAVSGP